LNTFLQRFEHVFNTFLAPFEGRGGEGEGRLRVRVGMGWGGEGECGGGGGGGGGVDPIHQVNIK